MATTHTSGEDLFRDAELKEERGDFKGAFQSLLLASKMGDFRCQINLGNFYAAGRGTRKDLKEAARWYRRAYRAGNCTGALNLAIDLEKQGNIRGAIKWLRRAEALNDGDACVRLARIYLKKRNGTKTATDLLKKAISLGPSDSSEDTKDQASILLKKIEHARMNRRSKSATAQK
jgi:TPR repeat protein